MQALSTLYFLAFTVGIAASAIATIHPSTLPPATNRSFKLKIAIVKAAPRVRWIAIMVGLLCMLFMYMAIP